MAILMIDRDIIKTMSDDRIKNDALPAFGSSHAIERALARFGWLAGGDYDDLLDQIGISRAKLRALLVDDEISAALETRRAACINTPWRIEHESSRARELLTEIIEPHMHSILSTAWEAVPFGYSVQEIVFKEEAGRISVAQVVECPFEWFSVRPDGRVFWRDTLQPVQDNFILTVNSPSLRKPAGEALLAKAYWPWFFRTHGWRMWAKFLEQAAIPLLYGKTMGDKSSLLDLLRTLSQGPVAVVDRDDELLALDQPGNSPNKFTEFEIAICRRIQRLILGQTLTSGTDGGSGNRALGEVHNEIRDEKRRADVRLVTQTAQRVLDMLAAYNGVPPGRLVLEDPHGLERDRAERDKMLVEAGILRFTRTYLEEKYGFEPDDFEEPPAAPKAPDTGAGFSSIGVGRVELSRKPGSMKPDRPRFTAGQQAIEDEIERVLPDVPSPIDAAAVRSAIVGAKNADDLYERLAVVLQDADDVTFRRMLERAMFAAEIMGYAHARDEAIYG